MSRRSPATPGRRVSLVEPWRLRRADPTGLAELQRTYERYDRLLARAAREAGLRQPAAITSNPFVAAFCPFDWARRSRTTRRMTGRLITGTPLGARRTRSRMPRSPPADVASARCPRSLVSASLQTRVHRRTERGGALGMALRRPSSCMVRGAAPPAAAHAERWIGGSTRARPRGRGRFSEGRSLWLEISPTRGISEDLATLQRRRAPADRTPRTRRDSGGGGRVPATAHGYPLTQAMSPLKVYEYLAGGRPVAAVDLPPLVGSTTVSSVPRRKGS